MRRVFLWAARNHWLKERLPRLRFMRRAVRRFMPGETLEDALGAALPLEAAGIGTMYTRLGENLANLAAADEVATHYIEAMDKIVAAGITGELSVKPTQLGLDHDAAVCLAHLERIAEHAVEWLTAAGATRTALLAGGGSGPSAGQHQAGTCRMGSDSQTSVVDPWCRVWGHDNVRVVDASVHVTNGGVNPVLTVFANAYRVLDQMTRC